MYEDIDILPPLNKVGDEPFTATKEYLYSKLNNLRIPIKTALLDQSIISGLGNIYVDEVLYKSRINPFMSAKDVTIEDSDNIIKYSIETLNESIKAGGSTIKSFGSINGESGHFQGRLLVHLRENERCYSCNNIIIKDKCGGRGTYYCPTCERLIRNSKYIAITGGFSSGKSTVLKMINELGYKTYSLDEIYNDLFINSKEMIREIDKTFKTHDKDKLKNIVFNSKEENDKLKTITHKYVMKTLFKMLESNRDSIAFIEVPLLYEGGFEKCFDCVIAIDESKEILEKLLMNKGYTLEDYKIRNSAQLDKTIKIKNADYVIKNDCDLDTLNKRVKELLKKMEV